MHRSLHIVQQSMHKPHRHDVQQLQLYELT
jgi:hypothetical protein